MQRWLAKELDKLQVRHSYYVILMLLIITSKTAHKQLMRRQASQGAYEAVASSGTECTICLNSITVRVLQIPFLY